MELAPGSNNSPHDDSLRAAWGHSDTNNNASRASCFLSYLSVVLGRDKNRTSINPAYDITSLTPPHFVI